LAVAKERNVDPNASAVKQANHLYWQTERSVADIAETLGVSRRALYELIAPEHAGIKCENCGGDVVFVNRSAKASNLTRCPNCGSEAQITTDEQDIEEAIPPYAAGWRRADEPTESDLRIRALKIAGIAIAGATLGAVTAFLFVRQR
jgi:predicted RNA-binding Zn-ribbon protein involved in translation (DUF1610 family)